MIVSIVFPPYQLTRIWEQFSKMFSAKRKKNFIAIVLVSRQQSYSFQPEFSSDKQHSSLKLEKYHIFNND